MAIKRPNGRSRNSQMRFQMALVNRLESQHTVDVWFSFNSHRRVGHRDCTWTNSLPYSLPTILILQPSKSATARAPSMNDELPRKGGGMLLPECTVGLRDLCGRQTATSQPYKMARIRHCRLPGLAVIHLLIAAFPFVRRLCNLCNLMQRTLGVSCPFASPFHMERYMHSLRGLIEWVQTPQVLTAA